MRISDWSSDVCSSDLRARGVAVRDGRDIVGAQPVAALPQRLFVAHRAGDGPEVAAHQSIADRQEMLADDRQARFGEQEMDVGDAAVQAVLDRNDRAVDAAFADRKSTRLKSSQ